MFNLGLADNLKVAFPDIVPAIRPSVSREIIPDPHWLSGFVSGEGCFMVNLIKSSDCKIGFQVQLSFVITQHCRDEELLKSLEYYLNSGKLHKTKRGEVNFHLLPLIGPFLLPLIGKKQGGRCLRQRQKQGVRKLSDLTEIIIPFFNKYPIIGPLLLLRNNRRATGKIRRLLWFLPLPPFLLPLPEASAPLLLTNQGQKERTNQGQKKASAAR